MLLYPAFRFHHPKPDAPAEPPRKVHTAEEDEALQATGEWRDQPVGNPPAPSATGGTPVASTAAAVFHDTGLRFPAFRFHPNGQQVKVANPEEDAALTAESTDWQPTPVDAATLDAYNTRLEGTPPPASPAGPGSGEANLAKLDEPPDASANILTAEQSIAAAKKSGAEDLAALEKAEKARQSPRVTVLNAIEARYTELQDAQTSAQ
jgi:hypothetical protein